MNASGENLSEKAKYIIVGIGKHTRTIPKTPKLSFPDATPEEKKALQSWVRKGRSPYENGWYIANESGGPMDFINALRFLEDEYQEFLKDPEGYRGCPDEQPENGNSPSGSSADDLPF
jgi:hypothetical protein